MKLSYKKTEIGLIPVDWEITTIGDLCHIFGRIGFRGYTVKDIVDEGNGAIAISPSNIQDGKTLFKNCTYISWHKYEESPEIKIFDGDVILVKTASTGKTAMVKNLPGKATLNPQMLVFKKIKSNVVFFSYMLGFKTIQEQIKMAVVGGVLPTLSQKLIAKFKFQLPSTQSEQLAIAKSLSDVDSLLATLDKTITKKRDLKQATMQQLLLGKTRISNFKEDWEEKALSDIAFISKGTQLPSDKIDAFGNFPHYNGGVEPSSFTFQSNAPANTIAISEGGNSCGFIQFITKPFWCGGHCYTIVPKSVHNGFLYYALKAQQTSIMALRVGSGLPNIQKTALGLFKLTIPLNYAEQTAIANIFSDMNEELHKLEVRRNKTKELKQAMMQELLTGKTRLIKLEAAHA